MKQLLHSLFRHNILFLEHYRSGTVVGRNCQLHRNYSTHATIVFGKLWRKWINILILLKSLSRKMVSGQEAVDYLCPKQVIYGITRYDSLRLYVKKIASCSRCFLLLAMEKS